jgi:glucose/arabinose dehydrogenase
MKLFKTLSLAGIASIAAFVPVRTAAAQLQHPAPLHTVQVANGLTMPLYVTAPVGDTSRLFIVEQRAAGNIGRIRILNLPGHTLVAAPYLSIGPVATGNEEGLLGLAFHPDFANNGFLFVYYTNTSGNNTVVRYTATAPFATSTTADSSTAFPIITFNHPGQSNHNGGWIGFGPDNYLYIATGDGGSGNDPPNNAQNLLSYLGKMHRLDVDGVVDDFPADAARNYHIPATNPFVGNPNALAEIWFYGLRNPWRNSFDRTTGDIWIGDVGQNAFEEIDFAPAGVGGLNFGWRCTEGNNCTGLSGCVCNGPTLTPPVHVYNHGGGCSVTGGYRYRGSALCGWNGAYFYTDYCTPQIFSFNFNGTTISNLANRTADLAPGPGMVINSITSFGEDANGELYIVDQGGQVYKVVPDAIVDCNGNSVHDGCDIDGGTSQDANQNNVPDECDPSATPYCFGDGSGSPCPCGNVGTVGNGCPNSLNPNGATLVVLGTPDLSNDSVILQGRGMPDAATLYFQGTTQVNGGAGFPFGDGLRCAGGSMVRLATKINVSGMSEFPEIFDGQLSTRGGLMPGMGPVTRTYQAWYRNPATFCTADTFNLTNGMRLVWQN